MAKPNKNKQCIAICRDVILQLNAKKYIPITQNYLNSTGGAGEDNPFEIGNLQPQIKQRQAPCGVCAIAGMFLSRVRIYNAFAIKPEREWLKATEKTPQSIYCGLMTQSLDAYFTEVDLAYVESSYESMPHFIGDANGDIEAGRAFGRGPLKKLKRLIPNNGERMKWIMRHIIRNNGNFNVKNAERAAARLIK